MFISKIVRFSFKSTAIVVAAVCLADARVSSSQQETLPSEASFPGTEVVQDYPEEATLPKSETDPINVSLINLPSEAELPKVASEVVIANEERERDERPWLRLIENGPTAPVRSVRFSANSKRLFAGGLDKSVHVWQQSIDAKTGKADWTYEKPLYWKVQRGNRGLVRSIASNSSLLAFAGYGYTVSQGEIALFDSTDLKFRSLLLVDKKTGAPYSISSVTVPEEKNTIATMDVSGRVNVWTKDPKSENWSVTKKIRDTDDNQGHSVSAAAKLRAWRRRGTNEIATTASGDIFYPELAKKFDDNSKFPVWKLMKWDAATSKSTPVTGPPGFYAGSIVALACSKDGRRVVTADLYGRVFAITGGTWKEILPTLDGRVVSSISISRSGDHIVVATRSFLRNLKHSLQVWKWGVADPILHKTSHPKQVVSTCSLSPDGKSFAFSQGNSVLVESIESSNETSVRLGSSVSESMNVAFTDSDDDYRFIIRSNADSGTTNSLSFDPKELSLKQLKSAGAEKWISSNPFPNRWKLIGVENDGFSFKVQIDERVYGPTRIANGVRSSVCWIPNKEKDGVAGIAIGTRGQNEIYLYRFEPEKGLRLVRKFRGHFGDVTSLSCSADSKYLLSSSADSTIRIWKIDNSVSVGNELSVDKWGAEFAIEVNGDKKNLVVEKAALDGPMYFQGIRDGDVIESMFERVSLAEETTLTTPTEMLKALNSDDRDTQYVFEYSRDGKTQSKFSLVPAWQPFASVVWNQSREWAFWTPYGYYNASFNGHKMFGWQVNRSIDLPPEFFRAAELKEEFERPEVMENLLQSGSLSGAFAAVSSPLPNNISDRLAATNRLRPRIEITSPNRGEQINDSQMLVSAEIVSPQGVGIVPPKAFANGVPAVSRKLLSKTQMDDQTDRYEYQWKFELPDDQKIKFQVLASSTLGHGAIDEMTLNHDVALDSRKGRIFLIATGVSQYDPSIPPLDFPVKNAENLVQTWVDSSKHLRTLDATVLSNTSMNRSLWKVAIDEFVDRLKGTAGPNDLMVVFLSGHGIRDEKSQEYFYLTSDTKLFDVQGRRYRDCISLDDLSSLSKIPCRKLVILDTCHSGAIQSLKERDLKSIVRTLESDLVLTLTASEGGQKAYESKEKRMGVFSARLIEALKGRGDDLVSGGNGDGDVSLSEIVNYLAKNVPRDAAEFGAFQNPTASPSEIISLVNFPLSNASDR